MKTPASKKTRLKLEGKPGKALEALFQAVEKGDIAHDAIIMPLQKPKSSPKKSLWTAQRIKEAVQEELVAYSLGELLEKARRAKGISAARQAKELGVSRSQIYQSELPGANLELATLLRHADVLGYKVEVVLKPKEKSKGKGERLVAVL
jgi:DNA-binding phage protein